MLQLIIRIAEWIISYLKEKNGLISETIQKELDRNRDYNIQLSQLQKDNYELDEKIRLSNNELVILQVDLMTLNADIERKQLEYESKLQERKAIIDGMSDDDVLHADLPSPSNG